MNQPLDLYRESRLDGRREFLLFPTELRVISIGSFGPLGNRSEAIVYLNTVRPDPNRLWIRYRLFGPMLLLTVIASTVAVVAFFGQFSPLTRFTGTLAGGFCAFLSGMLAAIVSPRVEYAQFVNDAGIVAFDIAASGGEVQRFPQFVEHIVRTIEAARISQ